MPSFCRKTETRLFRACILYPARRHAAVVASLNLIARIQTSGMMGARIHPLYMQSISTPHIHYTTVRSEMLHKKQPNFRKYSIHVVRSGGRGERRRSAAFFVRRSVAGLLDQFPGERLYRCPLGFIEIRKRCDQPLLDRIALPGQHRSETVCNLLVTA